MTLTETILGLVRQRIDGGATAYQVAKETGIHEGALGLYLKGEKIPRGDTLDKLADWLGVEVKLRKRLRPLP